MSLKRRIICKLLIEGAQLVKYKRFTESRRVAGDPISTIKIMTDQTLDEFYICDIGTLQPGLVRAMTEDLMMPITAGGGIHRLAQVCELIRECGVDKVVVKDADLADDVAVKFGRQAVVWAFDYGGDAPFFDVPDAAGEVHLTSIDRDGMGTGFDLGALRYPYKVPVVIAGGCGKLSHVRDAFAAGADAAAVSSMFIFSDKSPIKLRSWLISEGCEVRG